MDWIQFRVSINTTVVPDVSPAKRAKITGKVPFAFPLQKLEFDRFLFHDRSGAGAARLFRDANVSLHVNRVRAVVFS